MHVKSGVGVRRTDGDGDHGQLLSEGDRPEFSIESAFHSADQDRDGWSPVDAAVLAGSGSPLFKRLKA